MPGHKGFHQLSVYEEKQKNYKEALNLAKQAQADGWQGDWEKRIERLSKKLASHKIWFNQTAFQYLLYIRNSAKDEL